MHSIREFVINLLLYIMKIAHCSYRPGKLDSLFPIHQILCLYVGGWSIFHYSLYINLSSNIQKSIKSFKKLVKTYKNRIMKVEVVVLKPMRAGDGKQGIKFAWPYENKLQIIMADIVP